MFPALGEGTCVGEADGKKMKNHVDGFIGERSEHRAVRINKIDW